MIYVAVSGLYVGSESWTLLHLEAQTDKDFTVLFVDPEWDPAIPEKLDQWSSRTGVRVIRIPYRSAPGGRLLDWAQWNPPVLLAESENDFILRLQSFRMIPSNLVAQLRAWDSNVSFAREIVDCSLDEAVAAAHEPRQPAGVGTGCSLNGAAGDWFLRVADILTLNGVDEPLTMLFHFEDVDMEYRYRTAMQKGIVSQVLRTSGLMKYASNKSRLLFNLPDVTTGKYDIKKNSFPPLCQYCGMQWPQLQESNNPAITLADMANVETLEDLGIQYGKHWFICRKCDAPISHYGCPHYTVNHYGDEHRATIGLDGKWGRNLRIARDKALAHPDLADRVRYVTGSYEDRAVLVTG